jgi:hypothetical protein
MLWTQVCFDIFNEILAFEQILSTLVYVSKHNMEVIVEHIFEWRINFDINFPESMKKKM